MQAGNAFRNVKDPATCMWSRRNPNPPPQPEVRHYHIFTHHMTSFGYCHFPQNNDHLISVSRSRLSRSVVVFQFPKSPFFKMVTNTIRDLLEVTSDVENNLVFEKNISIPISIEGLRPPSSMQRLPSNRAREIQISRPRHIRPLRQRHNL